MDQADIFPRGMYRTKTHNSWRHMKERCLNKNTSSFRHYGGRGIKVCDNWMSFSGFLQDMGIAPKDRTLERIDTNGNYEPSNCKWATILEQRNNVRRNIRVTIKGKTKTLAEWCRKFGLIYNSIHHRIKRGWTPEEALYGIRHV